MAADAAAPSMLEDLVERSEDATRRGDRDAAIALLRAALRGADADVRRGAPARVAALRAVAAYETERKSCRCWS